MVRDGKSDLGDSFGTRIMIAQDAFPRERGAMVVLDQKSVVYYGTLWTRLLAWDFLSSFTALRHLL